MPWALGDLANSDVQIERKLAPFWRPLEVDVDDQTDVQLVYAARGLPIPEPEAMLPDDILAAIQNPVSPNQSTSNLAVPPHTHGGQVPSAGSEAASSNPGSAVASPTSAQPPRKSRGKAIAEALSLRSSRNNSSTDLTQREIALPNDPLVGGQPLEVVLYRSADDCPICFATYPPHLNYTRCCGNAICTECFVQIKRPDPHVPESHGEQGSEGGSPAPGAPAPPAPAAAPTTAAAPAAPASADAAARETHNMLVSEPAACPYCTQPEFGVTYEPPPFRRGLVYAPPAVNFGSSAMSSQTSLHSNTTPASPTSPPASGGRRRGQSLSASAPGVVTTDRIRPDWALKLASQRTTQARRAAAATALHQAAFIMYNPERQFSLGSRAPRFMRRNTSSSNSGAREEPRPDAPSPSNAENERLQQFEEVMMAEAIRLSLAAEEDRRRKAEREMEKEAKKEAKKREKEERKAAKGQKTSSNFYGDGQASTSRSSVSLGLGRRRGNSGNSNTRMESTPELATEEEAASVEGAELQPSESQADKGKAVDRTGQSDKTAGPSSSMPIPQTGHHGPSHLRQTSNISSLSSSLGDSQMGSYMGQGFMARAGDGAAAGAGGGTGAEAPAIPESLFNFASMASTLGIDLERHDTEDSLGSEGMSLEATRSEGAQGNSQGMTNVPGESSQEATQMPESEKTTQTSEDVSQSTTQVPETDTQENAKKDTEEGIEDSIVTLQPSRTADTCAGGDAEDKSIVAPEVRLIPGSPLPVSDGEFSKSLECENSGGHRGSEVA